MNRVCIDFMGFFQKGHQKPIGFQSVRINMGMQKVILSTIGGNNCAVLSTVAGIENNRATPYILTTVT